jgi:outer membrane PBP1 activator LpoA protein
MFMNLAANWLPVCSRLAVLALSLTLSLLLFLSGCATAPREDTRELLTTVPATALAEADALAAAGDARAAADAYLQLASQSQSPARQALELYAAQAFYQAGDTQRALQTLGGIDSQRLSAGARQLEQLVKARVALQGALAERALAALKQVPAYGLPPATRLERLGLLAAAQRQAGDPAEAAKTLDEMNPLLDDPSARRANQVSLLMTLATLPHAERQSLSRQGSGRLRAWASLLELLVRHEQADATFLAEFRAWQAKHGAVKITEQVPRAYYAILAGDYAPNTETWVLMPSSGRFSGAAAAIDAGLNAADEHNINGRRPRLTRANSAADSEAAYRRAHTAGAGLIIGPLQKPAVDRLTDHASLPVPTLALNRNTNGRALPDALIQFALAPEDEAVNAANFAWQSGLRSALLLYPQGPWGNRLASAFRQHWRALGGAIAGETLYGATAASQGDSIETLLAPGTGELIFLIATAADANTLWQRLMGANLRQLPVIATSHVHSGDHARETALAGLYFVDMPWLLDRGAHQPAAIRPLRQPAANQSATLSRLYAMGLDSYRLAPHVSAMSSHPGHFFAGASGGLSLDGTGRIQRELQLGRFSATGPVRIEGIEPPKTDQAARRSSL